MSILECTHTGGGGESRGGGRSRLPPGEKLFRQNFCLPPLLAELRRNLAQSPTTSLQIFYTDSTWYSYWWLKFLLWRSFFRFCNLRFHHRAPFFKSVSRLLRLLWCLLASRGLDLDAPSRLRPRRSSTFFTTRGHVLRARGLCCP